MKLPDCDACGLAVTLEEGSMWVWVGACVDYKEAIAAVDWDKPMKGPPDLPVRPEWMWGHKTCGSNQHQEYWIDAEGIDTVEKALAWTLHFTEKTWVVWGAWERLLRRLYTF